MVERGEAEWVRLARAGDARAFEMLVTSYERVVYATASRMLGNAEDARDVTQTVFVKAWQALDSFDPMHRFFSWIYRITVNESLNMIRARRPSAPVDDALPAGGAAPDDDVHASELREAMRAAMLELSDDYRQVIVLRHGMNHSYQEIARMIGVPEKTVKSRLYTARQLLAQALRRRGVTA